MAARLNEPTRERLGAPCMGMLGRPAVKSPPPSLVRELRGMEGTHAAAIYWSAGFESLGVGMTWWLLPHNR